MSLMLRAVAALLTGIGGTTFIVVSMNVRPADLTWLLFVLTALALASLVVLGHAALQRPRIDALTERTFIGLIIFLLGAVACLIVWNTDAGRPLMDMQTSSLLFRLAILGVLAVPAIWLGLYAIGRLGGSGRG